MNLDNQSVDGASVLLRSEDKGVVTLTLNRPNQFNSLSEELLQAPVHRVRQVQRSLLDERTKTRVIRRRRTQEEVAAPESTQVEVQAPLGIDEQGATPFLLQDSAGVLALQTEIVGLLGQVTPIGLGTEIDPSSQA